MRRLAALLIAIPLATGAAAAADQVQGTLSVDGHSTVLTHAYALQLPKEPPPAADASDDEDSRPDLYDGQDPATLSADERRMYEERAREQAEAEREYARQAAEEARTRAPGYVVVLAPRPLPAELLASVDAFAAGRLAGWLDAQPEPYVWLEFSEGGSTSHAIRGLVSGKPVKSFALDWNFTPTTESPAQIAGKLATEQDEKRRQFFESSKISLQATFDTAILPVMAPTAPAKRGMASGTMQVEGRKATLKHAYAYTTPQDALSDPGETTLVLSEIEIPASEIDSAWSYLQAQKKLGVTLGLADPRPGSIQASFYYEGGNYSYSGGGSGSGLLLVENGPKTVAGQAVLSGHESLALDARFNAAVLPADEPLELLKDKAAADSGYARQVRECQATLATGDLKQIRSQYRARDAAMLAQLLSSEDRAEISEFLRSTSKGSADAQVLQVSVRKDAVSMVTGSDSSRSQTTVLAKEGGEWKCLFDPVGSIFGGLFGAQ